MPSPPLGSPALRYLLLLATLFAAIGVVQPFLPAFLQARGLSPGEVSIALALGSAVRLLSGPLLARLADHLGNARALIAVCTLLAAGAALGFSLAATLAGFLLAQILISAAMAPLVPLSDALVLASVRGGSAGFVYGRLRAMGSVAYIAAAAAAGWLVQWLGLGLVPGMIAACLLAACGAALLLPRPPPRPPRRGHRGFMSVLRLPGFARLLLLSGLIQSSHAAYYGFSSIHWTAQGHAPGSIGLLWALGVVGEVGLFLAGARISRALGARGLALLAASAGLLRWLLMASTGALPLLALGQLLHAFTFGAQHLAAMQLIARLVPPEQAGTAQALHAALGVGLLMGIFTLASGPLYAAWGGGVFFLMAGLCALALPLALGVARQD